MRRQLIADFALVAVSAIWGGTFVLVKNAISAFPVFAFLTVRFTIATLSLWPLRFWLEPRFAVLRRRGHTRERDTVLMGMVLGGILVLGYGFQTVGLKYTTPAKAGFITGLYVVIVPIVTATVTRRMPDSPTWIGVFLAVTGLLILSVNRSLRPEFGDILVFFCAISFALHIVITGYLAPGHAPLGLTLHQLATTAILSGVISGLWERPWPPLGGTILWAALFTGVLASSIAIAIQTVAQRFTSPTHTALIFSMEPVFAALFSFFLAAEPITPRVILGGALIMAGTLVAELVPLMRS